MSQGEWKRTICDICSPAFHCGIRAFVRGSRVERIEGDPDHPQSKGFLCAKGRANRRYIDNPERIRTPMRRAGARGEGRFEPVSWDEALAELAERLLRVRERDGAASAVFFSGFSKWYRPFLHRFANSFGSPNYMTESSTCMTSTMMAWEAATGQFTSADVGNAGVFLGWAYNPYYSRGPALFKVEEGRRRGMKVIIVDVRRTLAAERLADLFLQPRPGTDGALAWGLAREIIENGWTDGGYIREHVHGFPEYAAYADRFTPQETERLTGVPAALVREAARMLCQNGPMAINESAAPLAHHRNGFQNYRAVMALSAITGNYDRKGGQTPADFSYNYLCAGFSTREKEFIRETAGPMAERIGAARFPLWAALTDEAQACDLCRTAETGDPYPVRAILAHGMNLRMLPDTGRTGRMLRSLDFFCDVDLFWTDAAKCADLVLPACSSFERGELKAVGGGFLYHTAPAVEPLYESRSDAEILCALAREMKLSDPLLTAGVEACTDSILEGTGWTARALIEAGRPMRCETARPYEERALTRKGYRTPTGKFELWSEKIAPFRDRGLEPLPVYEEPAGGDAEQYPFVLSTGARIPGMLHSRLERVDWLQALACGPEAALSPEDAAALGIETGDEIEIASPNGGIRMRARISHAVQKGVVQAPHGYRRADVNLLTDSELLDPYSGFPGYRSGRCAVRKTEANARPQEEGPPRTRGNFASAGGKRLRFDGARCTGCGACAVGCMDLHGAAPQREPPLMSVRLMEEKTGDGFSYAGVREACRHCGAPACVRACKTGAVRLDRETGLTAIEPQLCAGCRACFAACPFGVPKFGADGRMLKCDGCFERVRRGQAPVCAAACPFGALTFE